MYLVYVSATGKPMRMPPEIEGVVAKYLDLFEEPKGVVEREVDHAIKIIPGSSIPKGRIYRMSPGELDELRRQLKELVEKGWIRPSVSPYGSPVLFVPKKGGTLRMCIDYRGLNAITIKNREPNRSSMTCWTECKGAEGLKPDDAKVANIRDWPRPHSVIETRSFLGMTDYYRNFVKNCSIAVAPLTDLTRLDTPWEWTDRCAAAFRHLKHALTHYEVLKLPDPDKPFIITMDASQYGIGAVLVQQEGTKLRLVEYMSKKMPSQKLAKSTYEKELYAIYKALTHWRRYLLGRFFYFRTDHQTLKWMRTQPVLSDALKRWIEVIEQYDFEPQYLKGEYNKVADALSRSPDFCDALVTEFGLADDVTRTLVEAYREDPFMAKIIRRLETKDKTTFVEFELVNGLLFLEKAGNKRLCDKKTAANLLQQFWWPTMMRDAKLYVETCQVCRRDKPRTQAPLGLLKPLPIPERPGESLSMDFMDTLVTSKSGMRHIFVIVDRFGKYARLVAMPKTAKTEYVIRLFKENGVRDFGLLSLLLATGMSDSQLRSGKSTSPYTPEQQEKMVTLVKENRERKEREKQAKLKAIADKQPAKMKELEEEMEKKKKVVEEEATAEEEKERMRIESGEGSSGGTMKRDIDDEIEKKISEWVANFSLGEEEEAESYVTEDEEAALASELAAMTDPMERREREEEQKLAWNLRMKREKKRRREEVNKMTAEVAKVQEVLGQPDDKAKWDKVLEKLREADFKINPKKWEWAKTQVLYLGHVLDGDGIKPEDSKIAAIRDWPTPHTLIELWSLLDLANYYRKFVRNFSTIVASLRRLLKKEAIWQWDKDCTSALKKLKRALIKYPVLKVADPSLPFVITTDASRYGIGAVLQQDDDNGYRPVEFMSARMPSEKVATSTYERELYALRQALEHWKHYLLGRHFKVYSDHETLRWLKTQAKMTPKLTRWAAEIDQYDFELKPVKGKYNVVADALSRRSDYFGAIVHYLDIGRDLQEKVKQAYAQDPI
ncbi:hypothetical protein CBR_g48649 [Chara braunii]|uniref:Integrase catalytic domain-containing protein n=1 Tax=Chara braunii TaxID=69332 RepID=A0A388M3C3_CHABU|nr:hypothetical protein CBR_g48649 [Chara braunii]|eukprot:GBG89041.1 hypothetical protein CBR_g48649 [Chara braunii]